MEGLQLRSEEEVLKQILEFAIMRIELELLC